MLAYELAGDYTRQIQPIQRIIVTGGTPGDAAAPLAKAEKEGATKGHGGDSSGGKVITARQERDTEGEECVGTRHYCSACPRNARHVRAPFILCRRMPRYPSRFSVLNDTPG